MTTAVDIYDPPPEGKDYIVQVRIKNGPLLRAIRARGYHSIAAFSRASGIHVTVIHGWLALKRLPMTKKGEWVPTVLKLAQFLHLPPDFLFPEQHLDRTLKRNSGELEASMADVELLLAPEPQLDQEQQLERGQLHYKLVQMVNSLPENQRDVVTMRFGLDDEGERTLQEVADTMGVSRERVRQLEFEALRKLHHHSAKKALSNRGGYSFVDINFGSFILRDMPSRKTTHMGPVRDLAEPVRVPELEPEPGPPAPPDPAMVNVDPRDPPAMSPQPPETLPSLDMLPYPYAVDRSRIANDWHTPPRGNVRIVGPYVYIRENEVHNLNEDQLSFLQHDRTHAGVVRFIRNYGIETPRRHA